MGPTEPETFTGEGVVVRADGSCLDRTRRYSFTLLPYEIPVPDSPPRRRTVTRPGSMDCWVELWGDEPLTLEGEKLKLRLPDGRWIPFSLVDVSDTPPYRHTTIVEGWPQVPPADRFRSVGTGAGAIA